MLASTSYTAANLQNNFAAKLLAFSLPNLSTKSRDVEVALLTTIYLRAALTSSILWNEAQRLRLTTQE